MYRMLISSLVCVHIEAARVSESFDGLQEIYIFVVFELDSTTISSYGPRA